MWAKTFSGSLRGPPPPGEVLERWGHVPACVTRWRGELCCAAGPVAVGKGEELKKPKQREGSGGGGARGRGFQGYWEAAAALPAMAEPPLG